LILIGLYHSAISVANDVTLRKSIKNSALRKSRLLDSIGTAQMTQEIENKVTKMTADNANRLTEQSGIEPSLTDKEIKSYLDEVLEELSKVKRKQ
jgi:antitoxin component HigA of HigAB toxin-antitoxin module